MGLWRSKDTTKKTNPIHFRKEKTSGGPLCAAWEFHIIADNHDYTLKATVYANPYGAYYYLCHGEDDQELDFCIQEIGNYLEREYQISLYVFPMVDDYYDAFETDKERDYYAGSFTVDGCKMTLHFHYDTHVVLCTSDDCANEAVADDVMVHLYCHLQKALAKRADTTAKKTDKF